MLGQAHIAVIDPCLNHPELETFNRMAASFRDMPLSYHMPAMFGMGSLLEHTASVKGVIVLGSAASVHERPEWQILLAKWLKPLLDAGIPTLGICYGHQLLGEMLGGKVGYVFADHRKTKGWRQLSLHGSRLWENATGELVVSHGEMVATVPPDCDVICRSAHVSCEAFEHRTLPIWGLQSHPEATPDFMRNQDIDEPRPWPAYEFGHHLVDRFLAFTSQKARG